MPGAALTEPPHDGQLKGRITIKLGPMAATFAGAATLALDEAAYQGTISGSGRDQRSATRAKGRWRGFVTRERTSLSRTTRNGH